VANWSGARHPGVGCRGDRARLGDLARVWRVRLRSRSWGRLMVASGLAGGDSNGASGQSGDDLGTSRPGDRADGRSGVGGNDLSAGSARRVW
jgi:hypothetical protein